VDKPPLVSMIPTLPPSVLPDISPTRGEIGPLLGFRQSTQERRPISPHGEFAKRIRPDVGEMSPKATEGGATYAAIVGLCLFLIALLLPAPASAAKVDDLFRAWLADDLWP
jgi:hypothetical protein